MLEGDLKAHPVLSLVGSKAFPGRRELCLCCGCWRRARRMHRGRWWQCWAGLPWQGGQADCPQLKGLVHTHVWASYLCMSTISPAPGSQRIMECFGLEWTLETTPFQPRCCHVCIHSHTPGGAIMELYLTRTQPLEASLGVSSDIVGQARSGHGHNPVLGGAVCLGEPGRPQQSPRVLGVPPALPSQQAAGHPPSPGT